MEEVRLVVKSIIKNNDTDEAILCEDEAVGVVGLGGISLEDVFPYIMFFFALVEYVLMVVMVFGNFFILASYAIRKLSHNPSTHLSPSGRLVLNLAFADMLVGVGLCYFSVFKFWPALAARLARYRVPCVLRFSVIFTTMFGSHCALLVVAVDRYTAIVHTLHYKDLMTTRVSWCLVAVGWLLPVAGGGAVFFANEWQPDVPFCDEHYVVPQFLLTFALPSNVFVLITIGCAHWRVHMEVKAYSRRCADPEFVASAACSRACPAPSSTSSSASPECGGACRRDGAQRAQRRGSRKSAHVLLQVTGTFILCWTPVDVALVLLVTLPPRPPLLLFFECTFLLAMTSFLLNPFIYAWKTEATRKPLVSLLARMGGLGALRALGVRRPESRDSSSATANTSSAEHRAEHRAARGARAVFTISQRCDSTASCSNSTSSGSGNSANTAQTSIT